jgi:8-oxo-dGTP pyrophosphatase MutT (NUDIX family)
MKITVYYQEKPIYLADQIDDELDALRHHPDVVWIDELSAHAINALLHEIRKTDFHAGILLADDIYALKKTFFHHFMLITAAGGLVENNEGKFLFIFRRGYWDLPKGKLDEGETIEDCAKREIEEETGAGGLILVKKLGSTYHLYDEFGKHILKETVWFHFRTNEGKTLIPQTEEDIIEVRWTGPEEIEEMKSRTYATIRNLLDSFFE